MRFVVALIVAMSILSVGAAPKTAPILEGTWQVEKVTQNGRKMMVPGCMTAVIHGNTFTINICGVDCAEKAVLKCTDSESPGTCEFLTEQGQVVSLGIYELADNTLQICYHNKKRPATLASEWDSGVRLIVLKRQAK